MKIGFLPQDRRIIKRNKIEVNKMKGSMDSFWMATILKNVRPNNENYLFMVQPNSMYTILYKIKGNYNKNLEENIVRAFRREFATLKELGVDVQNYEYFLDEIDYVHIPQDLDLLQRAFKNLAKTISDSYRYLPLPYDYYIQDLKLDRVNFLYNTAERPELIGTPLDTFKLTLENYQDQRNFYEKRKVSFEENQEALTRPTFSFIDNMDSLELEDRKTVLVDTTAIIIKEPIKKNERKLQRLNKRMSNLLESNLREENPDLMRQLYKNIMKKINSVITYVESPFSGEYRNLEVPETLPEKPVFEFLITLGSESFKVQRRVAVPADMLFTDFDKLLSHLFRWGGFPYHLSSFVFPLLDEPEGKEASEVLEWQEDDLPKEDYEKPVDIAYLNSYDPFYKAVKSDIKNKRLNEYFPKFKTALYRYDYGDNWIHSIELVGIHDQEKYRYKLPYLIDSIGVAPIDDMGGIDFFESLINMDFDYLEAEDFRRWGDVWAEEKEFFLRAPCSLAPLFEK